MLIKIPSSDAARKKSINSGNTFLLSPGALQRTKSKINASLLFQPMTKANTENKQIWNEDKPVVQL